MHERPTILLPIRVLERESIPEGVPELLTNVSVVLFGYHIVPDQTAIDIKISRGDADQEMIIEAADNYDGIVMGESDPSVTTFLFGMTADQVAKRFLDPMFVIQHEETDANEPAEAK